MVMVTGRYRDRITLKSQSTTLDSAGQPVDSATAYAVSIPAAVADVRGTERVRADGIEAITDTIVELRYRDDVDASHEVEVLTGKYKGQTFDVAGVTFRPEYGRPRKTILHCNLKKPNG